MAGLISYGIGYTPNSTAATTLVIQPPPVYASGNLLVMGVIAGGPSGGVAPALPSGWTRRSTSGATLALFTKTATASESAYTVTLGSTSAAAGFVAAYPASTVVASSFGNSGSNIASYTATFPGGVTSGETVLLLAGSVANAYEETDPDAAYINNSQNLNLPGTWTADVPVFGPMSVSPGDDADALPCCIGLAEITGSTGNPALTNTDGGVLYAGFLVLTITGTPPSPYTVTATSQAPEALPGMALTVKALTGAAAVASIVSGGATESFSANGVSQAPEASITPNATSSVVYGVITENFGVTGGTTFTAKSGTTFSQNVPDALSSAIYGTLKSGTTTASTPVTLGGTAPANAYTVAALAEILASGSITEVATASVNATYPGQYATTSVAQTAVFSSPPPAGSLLVAMVSANSAFSNGNASVVITDTAGLTWTQLASEVYPAYAGVFIAQVPASTGWDVIQSAKTAATATGATSASATFGTNLSSGTKVIAAVSVSVGSAATVTGVSDGNGNSLTLIGRKTISSLLDVSLWAMDTPSGDAGTKPVITATLGASTGQFSMVIQEVSGLLPGTAPADGTLGSNSGAGGSSTGSPSYTSTVSDEYLVAVYGDDGGPETWTKPSALTADPNSINANSYADCAIAYGNSTGGTEAGSWALAGTSADWATLLVAFQLAGGGTTIAAADTWTGTDTAAVHIGGTGYDTWTGADAAAVTAQSTASPVFAASYSPAGATSLAVTAAQSGTGTGDGIALTVKVVTGASGSPAGATAESAAVTAPELSITPSGTGSLVYGAVVNNNAAAAFTAAATTTFSQNQYWAGDATGFGTFRSTNTTTASTPVTLGATAPAETAGVLDIALLEIKTSGTLAEDASSPATAYTTTATTVSTASFSPPPGSLLVAMVASDCSGTANQSMTMGLSDSSGLTWTRQVTGALTAGTGTFQVATVWTAVAPSSSGGDWTTAATPKTQAVTAAPGNVIIILGGTQVATTTLAQPSGGPASWTATPSSDVTGYCAGYAWSSAVPGLSQGGGSGSGGGTGSAVPLAVTTAGLPTAQVSQVYSVTLTATGGTGTGYTWTVAGGSLPAGLSLTGSTGTISGTPTGAAATASITVEVTDSGRNAATQALIMTVITGPVTGPSGTWVLAFADEFNVPHPTPYGTGPDPNTWADHYINGDMFRSNDGGNEVEWYPHGYYGHSVADSVLTLTTQWQNPQAIDPSCPNPLLPDVTNTGSATSGMASSHLSFALTYGYVEVREQHPTTPTGSATASWMETRDGVWPPEIDIDEWNAHAGDVHNGYLNVANTWQNNYYAEDASYHVYGMHLASSTVTFYVDGTQTYQATYDGNPFPWFIILNGAAGSTSTSAGYPFNYNIDYVRAWVPAGVPAAPVINSISPSDGIASGGDITVNFGAVSGATSYRVTASATDAMADGWGGNVGEPTERLTATGTSSPITVTGMPSGVRFNFTVAAINATGYSVESAAAGPQLIEIQLTTAALPSATAGTAYSATLTAQAGVTPYTWAVSSGSLPAGLSLNSSAGVISGTPTGSGTSDFTVKVTGASGWSGAGTAANGATAALSITTSGGSTGGGGGGGTSTLTITTTSLPGATTSTTYSTGLTATGGTGTGYTWAVSSGALPSWATLGSSAGDITGDPTAAGTANFTVKVTDSGGNTATQALSITTSAASSTNPSWDPSGSWTLAFDDEFTGTSLNTTYWGAGWQAKSGNSGPINSSEATSYTSNNVSVSGGYLNLALTGTSGASAACVTTNTNGTGGSQGFAAGAPVAFEARMNLPGATSGSDTGIYNWPAFWNDGQTWPTDGEIDVLEGLGGFAAYHIHDSAGGPGANVGSLGDYVGWHTFGCYWQSSGVIDFYYDGVLVGSETGNFNQPHYIIVNYTTTPGAGDPTGVMQVDWVRAWTPG